MIALSSLVLALILVGDGAWPARGFYKVAVLTTLFGIAYPVFSEWLNIVVRKSWTDSELMPVIPMIDAGLIAQCPARQISTCRIIEQVKIAGQDA